MAKAKEGTGGGEGEKESEGDLTVMGNGIRNIPPCNECSGMKELKAARREKRREQNSKQHSRAQR